MVTRFKVVKIVPSQKHADEPVKEGAKRLDFGFS